MLNVETALLASQRKHTKLLSELVSIFNKLTKYFINSISLFRNQYFHTLSSVITTALVWIFGHQFLFLILHNSGTIEIHYYEHYRVIATGN